jgi:hypothetical protein
MHLQRAILPIAPHMVGQLYSHGWGARYVTLPQALGRHKAATKTVVTTSVSVV